VSELALRDVGDEAGVGSGSGQVLLRIEGREIAVIPGRAEQGRQVSAAALEHMEDGGELLAEGKEAAIRRRLLIAQSIDEVGGVQASGGDAGGKPKRVDLGEEAGDLVPTGSLAGFAGFTDEHDEKIEAMTSGVDHAVGSGSDQVAEGGEGLEEDGGGVSLGVRGDGLDEESGEAMERGFGQHRLRALGARCRVGRLLSRDRIDLWLRQWLRRWLRRLATGLGLRPIRETEQFGSALFDFGVGGYMGAIRGACVLQHGSTIPFFCEWPRRNRRWRAGVAEIAFACMVTEMAWNRYGFEKERCGWRVGNLPCVTEGGRGLLAIEIQVVHCGSMSVPNGSPPARKLPQNGCNVRVATIGP